ncbi:hypothetical protein E308F_25940 [Moorella sp. E308F]|uniref:M23 family metallopeptidase n=1 Tax=Moorella sp. E308F TaxID=2572682 RepID=UPI0010FFBAAB|nr:M23 family metallopeptidase [Moorella sp. E308F]MDK2895802.1 hypothetical protein [Moorella sp. (in: firmicutes)]GEA16348.1 hypothetical protein E308F_25940 [Moorella sp. E308F]
MAAPAGLIARVVLALLPEPEKAVKWVLVILLVPAALLVLFFAGPVVVWERVPIASPEQVMIYVRAAREVSAMTVTPCDSGVTVDWQPLLAIDAVRLEQDFSKANPDKAEELARMFIEKAGYCEVCDYSVDPPECSKFPVYRLRPLEDVLEDLEFSREQREKVENILQVDLSFLLGQENAVPPGWTPAEKELKWPVPGVFTVTSGYGYRLDPVEGGMSFHTGVDIAAPVGTPVQAAVDGVVAKAGWSGNFGYAVYIRHGSIMTIYAHLSHITVQEGQQVDAGEVIAYSGNTGKSTGPHLHFEVRVMGLPVDPLNFYK